MTRVAIGIGTNLGDRLRSIQIALNELFHVVTDLQLSPIYESPPMYRVDQDPFLNAVLCGETELGPYKLLQSLKEIELKMGRVDRGKNGPREIDLDLLLCGRLILNSPQLTIPHPRIEERRFVLQPLLDVCPEIWHPHGDLHSFLAAVSTQHIDQVMNAPVSIPRI